MRRWCSCLIYISLWFYYDEFPRIKKKKINAFTFHSDSIMTKYLAISSILSMRFTFHSDSIMTTSHSLQQKQATKFTFHSDSIMTNQWRILQTCEGDLHFTLILLWPRAVWSKKDGCYHLHFTLILLWQSSWSRKVRSTTLFTFHSDSIMTSTLRF